MARALRLAERGLTTTQPNPRVGCVIVRDGEPVGEGWHVRAGGAHAEVAALQQAGEAARGATAYVTLEPCGLHGRTPPCADALIAAGVAKVVIAAEDGFQREGAAVERMRAAGIEVVSGLMRDAARELNCGFFMRVEQGRPFVRLKLAASLDGRTALASGESKWITGAAARADVQRWRARSSAILTGIGTVLADDPKLTVRQCEGEFVAPLRVVLDRLARLPAGSHLACDGAAPTLVFHTAGIAPPADFAAFSGVQHVASAEAAEGLDLSEVLAELARREVNELLVECGPRLAGSLMRARLVDELLLYQAPLLLGGDGRPMLDSLGLQELAERPEFILLDSRQVGDDLRLRLRPALGER